MRRLILPALLFVAALAVTFPHAASADGVFRPGELGRQAPGRSGGDRAHEGGRDARPGDVPRPRGAGRRVGRPQPDRPHDAGHTPCAVAERPRALRAARGLEAHAVELLRPGVGERRRGVGERSRRSAAPAGAGRSSPSSTPASPTATPAASSARRTSARPTSCAATTSSAATPTPTTRTATAPTSRARSARASTTAVGLDRPRVRREDHADPRARLDRRGRRPPSIARGVRYAARRGRGRASTSRSSSPRRSRPGDIPELLSAIRCARVAGDGGGRRVPATRATRPSRTRPAPATSSRSARRPSAAASPTSPTRAAGWTSSRPAAAATRWQTPVGEPGCDAACPGRPIVQLTYTSGLGVFGYPDSYEGTSMAAPHVAAAAALAHRLRRRRAATRPPRPWRSASRRPRATSAHRATTSATAGDCSTRARPRSAARRG